MTAGSKTALDFPKRFRYGDNMKAKPYKNPNAQALGRLGRGKSKTMTAAAIAARRANAAKWIEICRQRKGGAL